MNANIRRLGIFFLLAFGVIVADVTYWQVIDAAQMQARPDNPRNRLEAASVRRGFILDRTGKVLAGRTIDGQGFVHRYYTDPTLSQTIGYDSGRYGKSELEASYDDYLAGRIAGTSWDTVLNQLEHKPVIGNNVTLTIDDGLQQQVYNALPDSPSAAIVADPRSGDILAIASRPGFDANQINNSSYWTSLLHDPQAPLINRAVNGFYTPGSTFKIITMSGALDSGIMSLDTEFSGTRATGPITVQGHEFSTISNLPAGVDAVNLAQALMYSDNIVFAQVGLALGQSRFQDYAHRFGLDQDTPFDIPVSQSHLVTPGETFDDVALASSAFGQGGLHVTPLQMLMAAEAQADGGSIPRPILVKKVTAPDSSTVKTGDYGTLYTPISSSAADGVRSAMIDVVNHGSGFNAQIPGVQVAGKTGTAETGGSQQPHAWFVCFAPADHPRVAVAVVVEHAGEGAFVAAPIARQILEAALPAVH